jgi:hypothetical protein
VEAGVAGWQGGVEGWEGVRGVGGAGEREEARRRSCICIRMNFGLRAIALPSLLLIWISGCPTW